MQPQDMEASPMILTPQSSPCVMQAQPSLHSSQQRDHDNLFAPPRHPGRYNPQQDDMHSSPYINTAAGYVPRMNFNDQTVPSLQDQTHRSLSTSLSATQYHNSQQSNVNWSAPFYGNSSASNSTTYYATSPQSFSPHSYQLPPPNSQSILPSHPASHTLHANFDGLPHRSQYDTTPHIGSQLRTGSLGHPHQLPPHQHHGGFDFLESNTYGHHDADLKSDPNMHQG